MWTHLNNVRSTKYDVRCMVGLMLVLLCGCSDSKSVEEGLPFYSTADFTPRWLSRSEADTIHRIPEFSFTNQNGQTITRYTFENKITVVDFFFTRCPGICKKLTSSLSRVQETFKNDGDVMLLSHSVTPDSDSVPVLKRYAVENKVLDGKWHLITGDKSFIYRIARTAYFADEDMGWKQDSTVFLHTENILLLDGNQRIRGVYKGTVDLEVNDLIADIKKLKAELGMHVVSKSHHPNGNIYRIKNMSNGKEEGWQYMYYENGRLAEKRYYANGEKDGVHTGWWDNGNPRFEYHFIAGKYHGDFKEWYSDGRPLKHLHYVDGVDDWGKGWRDNGKVYMNYVMKDGRRYGVVNSNLCYTVK